MNTLRELVLDYGIDENTAKRMIDNYSLKIGTDNGDYKITDITYIGNSTRDIELTCNNCKKVIHRKFINGKNKWTELIKNCECNKCNYKKSQKIKKTIRNDDVSFLGATYGTYKIIGFDRKEHKNKSGSTIMWIIQCQDCKSQKIFVPSTLKSGKCKCSCRKIIDTNKNIGRKFNRLTIIDADCRKTGNSYHTYAICICDCGKKYETQIQYVVNGTVKSCGCYAKEIQENQRQAYHKTQSPLYQTWSSMKQRCNNPNNPKYDDYGGRGIKVCKEWIDDFESFEKWSFDNGYRPNQGLSIDRIDVNNGYSPDNCRWSTIYVQSVNKRVPSDKTCCRNVKMYEINGETHSRKDWCKIYDIHEATVRYRENNMGMSFEEALIAEKKTKGNHLAALNLPNANKNEIIRLNSCKSYIEANLYMAFLRSLYDFEMTPQVKIGDYIVDFLIDDYKIIIECDGYNYHKTKEQLNIDCKRERYLILAGYKVIRFSGSEINNDPDGCIDEINKIIKLIGGVENA